jgi:hypothetical protein
MKRLLYLALLVPLLVATDYIHMDDTTKSWLGEPNATLGPYFHMGEMYKINNGTATTISTVSTWTKFNIAGTLGVGMDFDMPATARLRYTGAVTKVFHCGATISIKGAGANDTFAAILYKNGTVNASQEYTAGTALTQGQTVQKLGAVGDIASTAIHVMPTLAQNDYLELAVSNLSGARNVTVTDTNIFCMGMPQ